MGVFHQPTSNIKFSIGLSLQFTFQLYLMIVKILAGLQLALEAFLSKYILNFVPLFSSDFKMNLERSAIKYWFYLAKIFKYSSSIFPTSYNMHFD